jgi:hypothetical protein
MRNVNKILIRKPEGKRPLRKPRHRWEGNTGMDLRNIGLGVVDWMDLAHDKDQ